VAQQETKSNMALFKSGNPALGVDTFTSIPKAIDGDATMSLQGTVNKCAILILLLLSAAVYGWKIYTPPAYPLDNSPGVALLLYGSNLGAIFLCILIASRVRIAPYLTWLYSVLEGLALGIISKAFNANYPGIVAHSILLTIFVFVVLLVIYKLELIRATENVKLMIVSATTAIALFYISVYLLQYYNVPVPFFDSNNYGSMLLSLFIAGIAALNFVVDFDFIEQGTNLGIPKSMEWYGAFGLLVTLVWLYLEILRLLARDWKNVYNDWKS
jgi:uncharacterized YccA/Bax inhibitor family protein